MISDDRINELLTNEISKAFIRIIIQLMIISNNLEKENKNIESLDEAGGWIIKAFDENFHIHDQESIQKLLSAYVEDIDESNTIDKNEINNIISKENKILH